MEEKILSCQKAIDTFFGEFLSTEDPDLTGLYAAMRYSALAGGKRLRPLLVLESCRMLGGEPSRAMYYAAALEMVHTYSLIHDDLPAMDDDDLRRGKPTSHKVFGEATAILAGDALLTEAFHLLANAPFSEKSNLLAVTYLAQAAGADGMVGGQVMDMALEQKEGTPAELAKMCSLKTGALFRAAVLLGAIAAGVTPEDSAWNQLAEYAGCLGLAFQVQDDILDVYGDTGELGKTVGCDEKNGKKTFLTYYTKEEAEEFVSVLTEQAIAFVKDIPDSDVLCGIAQSLLHRNN